MGCCAIRHGHIFQVLKRKEAALRVLQHRLELQHSGTRLSPNKAQRASAAQVDAVQHEVDKLRRERDKEAALLAAPKRRAERMVSRADEAGAAAAVALAAAADASAAAAEAEKVVMDAQEAADHARAMRAAATTGAEYAVSPVRAGEGRGVGSGARAGEGRSGSEAKPGEGRQGKVGEEELGGRDAWSAWRSAQMVRQERLKQSMRSTWKARDAELEGEHRPQLIRHFNRTRHDPTKANHTKSHPEPNMTQTNPT